MKKLFLFGLAAILALLLVQRPVDLQAMDSGMMGFEGGYLGYDMGPGMMHYGDSRDYGMGHGMMGQGYENEPHYYHYQKNMDRNSVERILKNYLDSRRNPNLKLGEIRDEGSSFEADLLTKDNSLVDKLIVDKDTGRMHSAY
jgi:hypothetical protein